MLSEFFIISCLCAFSDQFKLKNKLFHRNTSSKAHISKEIERLSNYRNEIKFYHNSNYTTIDKTSNCLSEFDDYSKLQFLNYSLEQDQANNYDQYPFIPQIESHLLQFTLNENRIYWLIHTLIGISSQQRIKLVDLHDKYLTQHQNEQLFHVKVENKLLEKYPLSWLFINSLTISFDQFDSLFIFNNIHKQKKQEIWENFLEMMLIDPNFEHKMKIVNNFKLEGRNLTLELGHAIKGDELKDLSLKSLVNNITDENKQHVDQIGLELCHLFKQTCSINLTSSPQLIKNYNDLNNFLTKNQIDSTIYESIQKFHSFSLNNHKDITKPCLNKFSIKYCKALSLIVSYKESISKSKLEYLATKINRLISTNTPGFDILRIFLHQLNKYNNLNKLKSIYKDLFLIDLNNHIDLFVSNENREKSKKKKWWKFWQTETDSQRLIDIQIYTKGIKSMLDSTRWCLNDCDLTSKLF